MVDVVGISIINTNSSGGGITNAPLPHQQRLWNRRSHTLTLSPSIYLSSILVRLYLVGSHVCLICVVVTLEYCIVAVAAR